MPPQVKSAKPPERKTEYLTFTLSSAKVLLKVDKLKMSIIIVIIGGQNYGFDDKYKF